MVKQFKNNSILYVNYVTSSYEYSTTNLNQGQVIYGASDGTSVIGIACDFDSKTFYYYYNNSLVDTATISSTNYNGTASNVIFKEGTKFQPDLVWIKRRSSTEDHAWFDSVRGVQKQISSNLTAAEYTTTNAVSSFDSNGFTTGNNGATNSSSQTYVAWCFNAGSGSVTSGTGTGSITNVSYKANTNAGFSIVKYTGSQSAGTVTHGLGVKPNLVLYKDLDAPNNWTVYSSDLTVSHYLKLNGTNAKTADAYNIFNGEPDTSVLKIGSGTSINTSGNDIIAYCFANIDSYQKIGTYTGTGALGNIVETGFQPAFILFKRTDSGDRWIMADNKRADALTNMDDFLDAQDSSAETSFGATNGINFLSNGFSINTTDGVLNANNGTYIYLAIAADPDITQPTQANSFDVVAYTGNGSTQAITELGFKPDLVWIKDRDTAYQHNLYDSVRGATKAIESQGTAAEYTLSGLTSFDNDGFTLGSNAGNNQSNSPNIAWCWKAADHDDSLPTINTTGTIDSSVSANQNAGFSIVKYNGTGTAGSYGHGLLSAPELIITKNIDWSTPDWFVYHKDLGTNGYLRLNQTTAEQTASTLFSSAPTSSVVNIGNDSGINRSNSDTQIAYCFHSVTGYQKIGSYTGTGTTSNFTGFGFQPRFIMIKRTDSTGNWWIFDSTRGNNKGIRANLAGTEDTVDADANTYEFRINFISDGFQYEIDNSTSPNPDLNVSGSTYIYLAIA